MLPARRIGELNQLLKHFAQDQDLGWIDYYTALEDGSGGMAASYSRDGVHPVLSGYKVMEQLAVREISRRLKLADKKAK